MPSELHQRLHENQVTIAARHRGGMSRRSDGVEIHSNDEALRYLILEAPLSGPLPEGCHSIRVMPWAGDLSRQLFGLGFMFRGRLRYMSLRHELPPPPRVPGYRVEQALTREAIAAFTDIQLDAFPGLQDVGPRRLDFLLTSQLQNLGDPSHFYLLGYLRGRPVSAGLLLRSRGVGGLYSLATLRQYRGRGLSRVIISSLVDEARRTGCDVISLQVSSGAPAEQLYRRLGFELDFEVMVYERRREGAD